MTRQEILYGLDKLLDKIDTKSIFNKKYDANEIMTLKTARKIIINLKMKLVTIMKIQMVEC